MPFAVRTALRHLARRPLDAALNVLGLALGLAVVGLVALFLASELSVDRALPGADRVVRLSTRMETPDGETLTAASGPAPLAGAAAARPDVEATVRLVPDAFRTERAGAPVRVAGYAVDASFFDVLAFPLAAGDPATALAQPGSAVLTASAARRATGTADALGQTLDLGDGRTLTVTGILPDGVRSHLQFDVLLPLGDFAGDWTSFNTYTFVRLAPGADRDAFAASVRDLAVRTFPGYADAGMRPETIAEPLRGLYFSETEDFYQNVYGDARLVWLLGLVALAVLAVAAVNFVNLATARSAERAAEIGVRKAIGAERAGLVGQFLVEALVLAALAGLVALALVAAGLPAFNGIVGSTLMLGALPTPGTVLGAVALVAGVGVAAGLYPALVLAGFRPAEALRGRAGRGGAARLRRALVVFQFAASTALLAATLVVGAQLGHLRAQDDGFERERVLRVDASDAGLTGDRARAVKEAVAALPGVEAAAWTQAPPGLDGWIGQLVWRGDAAQTDSRSMETLIVDADYAEALGLQVVAGRDLDARASDAETGVLLNEAGARALGWTPQQAVGETVRTSGREAGEVVGVVADYRHHGAGAHVGPQILFEQGAGGSLLVRAAPGVALGALAGRVEGVWQSRVAAPFASAPLDAVYDAQYAAEERLARAFAVFAALAVVVACLGLFGLAAYVVGARRKEVGVRKVLGATVGSLVARLSLDFAAPVVVGLALAALPTWWALSRWLGGFAERVALGPAPFLAAGLGALALALLTVSLHTVRAATVDPARALRSE